MTRCEFCLRKINLEGSIVTHENICQEEWVHYFCSNRCKEKWVSMLQKNRHKLGVSWLLGRYIFHTFFIRKFERPKIHLSTESWFSEEILDVKRLVPIKSGNKTTLKVENME